MKGRFPRTFGTVLKAARLAKGLTQRKLAAEVGVKAGYISYLEKMSGELRFRR